MEENHGDNTLAIADFTGCGLLCGECNPDTECEDHAYAGHLEEGATE